MDNRNVVVNELIGQPEIKKRKMMDSQPTHQVKQESNLQEEQGQSTFILLPAFKDEYKPSTSHQSDATSLQSNDGQAVLCKLCNHQYIDPRFLDCLHSFCLKCLDKPEVYKTSSGKQLRCPDCHQDTDVPLMGVSGLCKDFIANKLVEEQGKQLLPQGYPTLCQACQEKRVAVALCKNCEEFVCFTCKMAHQRFNKMKSHIFHSLEDLSSGKVPLHAQMEKCRHHAGHDLCMFCNTCQEKICLKCVAFKHCKPNHDYVEIKTAAASCRSDILKVLTPLERNAKKLQAAKTLAEQTKKKLESNVAEVLEKMAKKKKSELGKLTKRLKILKDKAESVAKERSEVLDKCWVANTNATKAEFILKRVRSMISDEDCHDLITLKVQILKSLNCISKKKAESVPLDLTFIDFTESLSSGNNLGELVFEELWGLKNEFGNNSVLDINFEWVKAAVGRLNGDMVVLDCLTNTVVTLTSKGVNKGTIKSQDPRGIFISPVDIALSSSEHSLVLDSAIKVFDKDGIFISRLVLSEGVSSAKCMDAGGGKIAIGAQETILLFDEDGSNPISIPAKLIDKHIAICNKTQSLIYTNYEKSRLVSVDFSGKENFNVSTVVNKKSVKPTGVCIDKTGEIYIAVHTGLQRGTGEIHHYSAEGSYVGFVTKNLYNPVGISLSPIGELMVADRHSVKVFQRV
ncbi:uncharacterized protein [Asterias amurensis]